MGINKYLQIVQKFQCLLNRITWRRYHFRHGLGKIRGDIGIGEGRAQRLGVRRGGDQAVGRYSQALLLDAALERAARLGFEKIVVFPYFLFTGVLVDRIYRQTDRFFLKAAPAR